MGCSDEEIVAELVAKGETKAAVEGALRGVEKVWPRAESPEDTPVPQARE